MHRVEITSVNGLPFISLYKGQSDISIARPPTGELDDWQYRYLRHRPASLDAKHHNAPYTSILASLDAKIVCHHLTLLTAACKRVCAI